MQASLGRHPHQQRPDSAVPATLTWPPATDHDLLGAVQFDLEPGMRTPSRLVDRIAAFGDDTLESKLISGLQCRSQIAFEDRRYLDP